MAAGTGVASWAAVGAALLIGAALTGACTMDFGEFVHGGPKTCTPGELRPCVGPGPCDGFQECAADGKSLGPCICGGGGSGGSASSSGAGGGGAAQGGSGGQ